MISCEFVVDLPELHAILDYRPDTGEFLWKQSGFGGCVGRPAGTIRSDSPARIVIHGISYAANKLAWYYAYGVYPTFHLRPLNGNKADTRLANLTDARFHMHRKPVGVHYNTRVSLWAVLMDGASGRCVIDAKEKREDAYASMRHITETYAAFQKMVGKKNENPVVLLGAKDLSDLPEAVSA